MRTSSDSTYTRTAGVISTCWPTISNPVQFVRRYAPAIRRYLQAFLRNSDDADEAAQDFLVRVFDRGFVFEAEPPVASATI